MQELYSTIAALCAEKGLTVSRLCKMAGVSPGILSDLKNGRKKTVSVDTAAKLAEALGVSADVLTGALPAPTDELVAFYGTVKDYLDEQDKNELMAFMRMKAELKKHDQERAELAKTE